MDEDSEIIASNLEIFDQNDNKLFQDDDKTENNFVGIGEDPNLERNFITSSVKKIKKTDMEDELDAKGPPEAQYLCKVVQRLVLDSYSPLKTSDFQDRESILNALNSLLLSISRDDSLLEWMENSSHFLGFAENFTDITNHPSSNYRATSSPKESLDSSLGILSNLSSFSSNEAIQIDNSGAIDLNDSKPTYDYLSEIEDLQHKIKGLNEERTHLLQQMAQTEDMNSNLFYENQDLQRKQQNLQGILEKMKEAEREYARLKLTVSNYEETNHALQEKLTGQHRERLSLEARIRDLNDEITIVNQELDGLRNDFDELNEVLVQTRQELSCMKDANDILNHNWKEESEMLKENERKLSDLLESNKYLKDQKSELEERVCLLEEEIASLQNYTHRAQVIPQNEIDDPTFSCSCNNESSILSCANCSSTTIDTKISGKTPSIEEEDIENEDDQGPVTPIKSLNCIAASTPMRNEPILVKIPSLCAEMRDMLRTNGTSLPTPFCGKHILPAALYRDRSLRGLDETDSPKMKIPKLVKDSRQVIDGSYDISSDSSPDFNLPKCTCGSLVQNVIFQENFLPMAKLAESPDILNILQETLQELVSTLLTINADTTATTPNAPQAVAETNGIINEPPPSSNTQGGVDESLKDQINCELKVLRSQIAKTQAILSYLSRGQKLPAGIASLNSFIIEKDSKHRAKSDFSGSFNRLSGDLLAASESGHKKGLWAREHVRNPSYSPSQKSTPLHRSRWLTKSCPNLPSHWSVINRSTQTENSQMASESTFPRTPTSDLVPKTPTTPPRISPNEKPESDEVDSPPTNREDILSITVSPLALRNRSSSYVQAIKKGNWDDASSNLLTVGQDVVIVHDKTPDFKSPPSEDDNKNHKDVASSYDDDLNGYLNENRNAAKSDPELECEPQIELSSNLSEKAKKRRRSFSEHNSSYSGTIDLEEHEADLTRPEQMQGPFVTANSNGSPPLPMDKVTTAMPVSLSPPSQDVSLVKFPKASAAFTARVALSDKPKRLGRNPRFLMPDVMETSETESAKDSANGSMESETTEPITTTTTVLTTATTAVTITTVASAITTCSTVEVIKPPPPGLEPSFPSLPDDFLKKLNLEKGSSLSTEEMTSQEVESKFGTLSLAFKTDKFTLSKRLEIQKRQRDMAEGNIDKEVGAMREALNALNHMCTDSQMRDLIVKVQHQIDIVHQSTSRMSSRAEVYGAVQQEERMSHAYEIMVTYVENLKRLYQKEHHELEDTRRVLIENRLLPESNPTTGSGPGGSSDLFGSSSDDPKRPTRTSIASGSYKPHQQQTSARRRASVAVFHRPIIEAAKSCIGTLSNFGASASNGEFRARLYSAVSPSISPAKLERLTAVAVTSGAASCSTPSPPITPSSNNSANQRFPFPIAAPSTTGSGHLRKLAIGSSATGPLNSLNGNEELLAALDRVEKVENAKTDSQKSESEEKSKESNNNEVYNEEPKEVEQQVEHQRLVSTMKSSSKEETRDASANDASQQTTRSAFNPYPYYRQLSRILFRNDPIRQNHWLSNWLPDDGWWSHWNFNTVSRNVRFSVSFILIVGALLSIIVTFFPTQTTACGSSATYVSRSVQEFIADILRPYVTFRNNNPPV